MSEEITGYDALNFDGLERRGNYRFIAYREDMLHALDKKDAAATIYQIVYRWQVEYKRAEVLKKIEDRKKSSQKPYTQEEVEDMMFVYMSYNDFVHESGGAIGYNTVIRTLDYLVDKKKALKQRPNHDPKYPDFEYSVNKEVVRELLNALPPDPAFAPKIPKKKNDSTQMGTPENPGNRYTQMGTGSTQTGIPYTQMGTEVYPNGGTSQELTSNTQELTGKTSMSSSDDAPSHQSEKDVYEKRIAELENKIAYFLQASKDGNYPPVPPKGDARPTSAGGNASSQDSASRIHPEHSFIRLDDLDQPTVMIVTLTHAFPHPHSSEMEDKRRERIAAWEVLPTYKKQGLEVEVRWEHETERQAVDAATIVESTVAEGKNHVSTHDIHSDLAYRVHRDNAVQEAQGNGSLMEDVSAPSSNLHNGLSSRSHVNQDVVNTPSDHNAILEPPVRATMPLTQESATIPHSENAPSESPLQPQEMPSSTQAVDESNRQATEQGASNVSSSLIPVDTYPRNIGGLLHHSEIGGQQNQESISLLPDVGASNSASMVCDIPNTQLKQASGVSPIAGVTTENPPATNNSAPQKARGRGKKAAQAEQGQLIVIAPEMPSIEAKWNEETAVQIIEAKKGRRYSDTTRSQEKSEAKKVLAMNYDNSLITREQYEKAVDDMISWPFWKEHTNVKPMIKTLRKDDKIITILDDLQAKSKPASKSNGNIRQFPQTAPQERSSVLVSEEARARNLARLRANAAAAQA